MAKDCSFDVVSDVDMQEVDNAINQTVKEINQRFDFRGSKAEVKQEEDVIKLVADSDYKLQSIIDILHAKVQQVDSDLYVSPNGDNSNGGLSWSEPLSTISFALLKILADSLHPHSIHLSDGIYSNSMTGEFFPLLLSSYISLSGESAGTP